MGHDERLIIEHLAAHRNLEEFQCLRCNDGFHDVAAIREHMATVHPSNYLLIGARRALAPCENGDDIQLIYIGNTEDTTPYTMAKCSALDALNEMDPNELDSNKQRDALMMLHSTYGDVRTVHRHKIPKVSFGSDQIGIEMVDYKQYAQNAQQNDKKCVPMTITCQCITTKLVNDVNAIALHIDRAKDIDAKPCKTSETVGTTLSMLLHRQKYHLECPVVFLQSEERPPLHVRKIVRCTYQCQLCDESCARRRDLLRHFNEKHSNHWFAAKICVNSHVIESNDPQQPLHMRTESCDYFYYTFLKCAKSDCKRIIGTLAAAIAHYNGQHGMGSKIDRFEVELGETIAANTSENIEPYVQQVQRADQMCLFECQHCQKLFDGLDNIKQHFGAVHAVNAQLECRFVVKRLYRCLEDNRIRTFAGIRRYESKYKKPIHPVNMLLPKSYCGLCDYNYNKNNDLDAHYESTHADGDTYTDGFLQKLELKNIDINQCKFAMVCCASVERDRLRQIVDHALTCERRFACAECPDRKFSDAHSFVMHCTEHSDDMAKIVDDLHDFKKFLALLLNVQIILPTGLVATMLEIRNTVFGSELQFAIAKMAKQSWEEENV